MREADARKRGEIVISSVEISLLNVRGHEMLVHEKTVVSCQQFKTHRIKGCAHFFSTRLCHRKHILHPAILREKQSSGCVIEHETGAICRVGGDLVQQPLDRRTVEVHADAEPREKRFLLGIVPTGEKRGKRVVAGEIDRYIIHTLRYIDPGTSQPLPLSACVCG